MRSIVKSAVYGKPRRYNNVIEYDSDAEKVI